MLTGSRFRSPNQARFRVTESDGMSLRSLNAEPAVAAFDTPEAFTNANTLEELQRLH